MHILFVPAHIEDIIASVGVVEPLTDIERSVGHYRPVVKSVSSLGGDEKLLIAGKCSRRCEKSEELRAGIVQSELQGEVIQRFNAEAVGAIASLGDISAVFQAHEVPCEWRVHFRVEYTPESKNIVIGGNGKALLLVDDIVIVLVKEPVIVLSQVKGIDTAVSRHIVVRSITADDTAVLVLHHKAAVHILYNSCR